MSALLLALGGLVRAVIANVLGQGGEADVERALTEVEVRREPCAEAASRRASGALTDDVVPVVHRPTLEWLSYAALLVQVDRIVDDLSAAR